MSVRWRWKNLSLRVNCFCGNKALPKQFTRGYRLFYLYQMSHARYFLLHTVHCLNDVSNLNQTWHRSFSMWTLSFPSGEDTIFLSLVNHEETFIRYARMPFDNCELCFVMSQLYIILYCPGVPWICADLDLNFKCIRHNIYFFLQIVTTSHESQWSL
jgi:hypothetical protein